MKIFIDSRLFAISAGKNIFSPSNLLSGQIGATGRKMNNEKFVKLNISIPPDLHRWIKNKQEDFKEKNPLARLDVSPIIADCIRAMKESEEGKSTPPVRAGANPLKLSESSATGLSTRNTRSSRKAG